MSTFIFYKAQYQYDVGNVFVDQFAGAFRELGHQVHIVDFLSNRWQSKLSEALSPATDYVIAFNAIASDLRIGKISPYDHFDIRFIPVLLNHPSHHLSRIGRGACRNQMPLCVDRTHLDSLAGHLRDIDHRAAFLPHAACLASGDCARAAEPLDVVFAGSGVDPKSIRDMLGQLREPLRSMVEGIVETCLADEHGHTNLHEVSRQAIDDSGIDPDSDQYETFLTLIPVIDGYLRATRRLECLRLLDQKKVPVQIFGDGWGFAGFRRHTLRGTLPFPDMLTILAGARVALDVSPATRYGTNERVLSAMAAGAHALATHNPFYAENFRADEISTWRWADRQELPGRLRALLAKPEPTREAAAAGRQKVVASHGWLSRAQALLDLVSCEENPSVSAA